MYFVVIAPPRIIWLIAGLLFGIAGCASKPSSTTVVWISLDGMRQDYLDRFAPPTLTRLAKEGAYSKDVVPVFPSLTFPNHIAQATGTTVDRHGIPLNAFFDQATLKTYTFPDEGDALRAEPIWVTAKRQGVGVATFDWPMSHAQHGPWASDFSWEKYDSQTDEERLNKAIQILQSSKSAPPWRLIIAYMAQVDQTSHRSGPESDTTREAFLRADQQVDRFLQGVLKWFDSTHSSSDELYLLITTDHGMMPVHTLVNLELLMGAELAAGARSLTSGPVACINLVDVPADQKAKRADQILERLRGYPFVSAWKAQGVPERLKFRAEGRIGDVVVLLAPGYNLTTIRLSATQPVAAGAVPGAHGYDPAVSPDMHGLAIVWRYRRTMNGVDLGPVQNAQWHATVAKWLGIRPADGADPRAVKLP